MYLVYFTDQIIGLVGSELSEGNTQSFRHHHTLNTYTHVGTWQVCFSADLDFHFISFPEVQWIYHLKNWSMHLTSLDYSTLAGQNFYQSVLKHLGVLENGYQENTFQKE